MRKFIVLILFSLITTIFIYTYHTKPSQIAIPDNGLIYQVRAHKSGKTIALIRKPELIKEFTDILIASNINWENPGDTFPRAHTTIILDRKDTNKGDVFWLGNGWIGAPGKNGAQLTYVSDSNYQKIITILNENKT